VVVTSAPTREQTYSLIESAKFGDRDAFNQIVLSHYQGVINVIYRMSGSMPLAEDIAQETFIRVWQKLHTYKPTGSFRSWVYRIATNAALDALRKERDTQEIDSLPLASKEPGVEQSLVTQERAEMVREAVLALPAASRSVLILREYEGLSYQEISDALDIPIGTVMSRLNYARNALKKSLAAELEAA
jgi:RNA polymerase sigma-70 factor (ECF subfamily)